MFKAVMCVTSGGLPPLYIEGFGAKPHAALEDVLNEILHHEGLEVGDTITLVSLEEIKP